MIKKRSLPSPSKNETKKNLFSAKLATLLLVQSKLLPPSALGIKDLKNKI